MLVEGDQVVFPDLPSSGTIVLAPATFGYGPSSHAVSIAAAIRARAAHIHLCAVADGSAESYLKRCGVFNEVFSAAADHLPDCDLFKLPKPIVFLAVTDFTRAVAAKLLGIPTIVVDALYWMWDRDPIDPRSVNAYLCLSHPGVEEKVAKIPEPHPTVKIVSQITEPLPAPLPVKRPGCLLNFGGGVTPFVLSYDYMAALIKITQAEVARVSNEPVLVTCSEEARDELMRRGICAQIESLSLSEMLQELCSRRVLITLPGLSIIWEAARACIPTLVVPGISYSQHLLIKSYIQFIENMRFFDWDDLHGYSSLKPGLHEEEGVKLATAQADRFSHDAQAQQTFARWLHAGLLVPPSPPALRAGHPWGNFTGSEMVASEALALLQKFASRTTLDDS